MKSVVNGFFGSILLATSVSAAPQISPQMLDQFKSLPQSQQIQLAKQYGIELPQSGASSTGVQLAVPVEKAIAQETPQNSVVSPASASAKKTAGRFGLSLFNRDVSTFAPTDNVVVPSDYRLGVGDELVVQLFGKENSITNLQIGRDGVVNFPKLGPISLVGLNFEDAQQLLKTRVKEQFIGVDVAISMGRLRAMNIFLSGEVKVPGAYSVSALTTVTQAIFQGGGISDIGSLRDIQVLRQNKKVASFDVYDLLLKGDGSGDVRLQTGDVVFVPTYKRIVDISGEVKRPMKYEVAGDERLSDALKMAGGFSSDALSSEIVLIKNGDGTQLPQAQNVATKDATSISLSDGDIVRVLPLSQSISNTVTVDGAVSRDGVMGWHENMRITSIISDVQRDLTPNADLTYSLILREVGTNLDIEVIQFSLVDALLSPGSDSDPKLESRDRVLIFSYEGETKLDADRFTDQSTIAKQEQEQEQEQVARRTFLLKPVIEKLRAQSDSQRLPLIASISGAVRAQSTYPLANGLTVNGLVKAAGGTTDAAFTGSYEVRRLAELPDGSTSAKIFDVSSADARTFNLKPLDHVTVKRKANWGTTEKVTVSGEFLYPGEYVIMPGETLKDLVTRAGGLSAEAFIGGAEFTRMAVKDLEQKQAKKFANDIKRTLAATLLTSEQEKTADLATLNDVVDKLANYEGKGRLVIDLKQALSGDKAANLVLQDGDRLYIPKQPFSIAVVGEVRQPGAHLFDQELSIDDYLSLSAGSTVRSDEDNLYVVRASGAVIRPETSLTRFVKTSVNLQPGDTIVVPVDGGYQNVLPFWRDVTQVIYQGVVSIAAVSGL